MSAAIAALLMSADIIDFKAEREKRQGATTSTSTQPSTDSLVFAAFALGLGVAIWWHMKQKRA
jgi:hypothetical protein